MTIPLHFLLSWRHHASHGSADTRDCQPSESTSPAAQLLSAVKWRPEHPVLVPLKQVDRKIFRATSSGRPDPDTLVSGHPSALGCRLQRALPNVGERKRREPISLGSSGPTSHTHPFFFLSPLPLPFPFCFLLFSSHWPWLESRGGLSRKAVELTMILTTCFRAKQSGTGDAD